MVIDLLGPIEMRSSVMFTFMDNNAVYSRILMSRCGRSSALRL